MRIGMSVTESRGDGEFAAGLVIAARVPFAGRGSRTSRPCLILPPSVSTPRRFAGRRGLAAGSGLTWTPLTAAADAWSLAGSLAGNSRDGVGGGILVVDYHVHSCCIDRGLHASQDRIWQHWRNRRAGPCSRSARHSPPQRQVLVLHLGPTPLGHCKTSLPCPRSKTTTRSITIQPSLRILHA